MSFTHLHTVDANWFLNGTSPSLTVPSTGAGNLLIMAVTTDDAVGDRTFPSGWATPIVVHQGNVSINFSYYLSNPGGITSITIGGVNNTAYTDVRYLEFSCSSGNQALDNSNSNSGSANPVNSVTFSPLRGSTDLVVSILGVELYNDTGVPTFDSGFTGSIIGHQSTGTTYAEYDVSASSGTTNIQPSGSVGANNWGNLVVGFYESTPQRAISTSPTVSTSMSAVATSHSGALNTSPSPSTVSLPGHTYSRMMPIGGPPRTSLVTGGGSPRTVPMVVLLQPRTRYVPQDANLIEDQPFRTVTESLILLGTNTIVIPQGVCFVFRTVPQNVSLLLSGAQRTVSQIAVFREAGRIVPQMVTFTATTNPRRAVSQAATFAVVTRVVNQHATFITGTFGKRIVFQTGTFAPTQRDVQRTVPNRGIFQPILINLTRTVGMVSEFLASPSRIVPQQANIVIPRSIPMTVQSPLIGIHRIPMVLSESRTSTRVLYVLRVNLAVRDNQEDVPMGAVFTAGHTRTVPEAALLAVVITGERTIPEAVVLQSTPERVIGCRALLGGPTFSWIICKPETGVDVCPELSSV